MTAVNIEDEITETRENLVWASELSWNYIIMNCLAATVATYGLFSNSPAVVIGAMIIAMLLGPISSLALGIIEGSVNLILKSLLTLITGVLTVCLTSAFWGWLHISSPLTNEIMARTSPNLMDLMIALAGGMAGALSLMHKRLATAFVGVAIATALVPPLASASILLVRGDFTLARGAFLLTFTNIVGIQFGYSLVLWLGNVSLAGKGGESSLISFVKRNMLGLIIMLLLGALLTYNLSSVVGKFNFERTTQKILTKEISAIPGSDLDEIRFDNEGGKLVIRVVVRGPNAPDKNTVAAWESKLAANYLHIPNELRIRFVKTVVITKEGELFNDNKVL